MNKVIETIMKGVKRNERKILSIGTGVSIVLFGFSVWFKKDKIVGHFERTREKRNSDDPKERREGNVELAKSVVWDGLPVAASFALAEACVAGSYVASTNAINEAISTGVEALSEMTAVAYHGSHGSSAREFVKPYDDVDGTIHDIQNQTSYVSARDVLIRDAIAKGYQLAYFKPTGSYIFYKGNIDDVIEVANAKIKSIWNESSGLTRSVTMTDVHDAFGITDTSDISVNIGFIAEEGSVHDEPPTFYKQRPDDVHGVNSVMWEVYTTSLWRVGDKYHDYKCDIY